MGGKYYLANWIIPYFPAHQLYVEVFGGAGHILFKKESSKVEIFNDRDDNIANFFKVIRQNLKDFEQRIHLYPYSRSLFYEIRDRWQVGQIPSDRIDRAVEWYYLIRCSFNSNKGSFGYGKKRNLAITFSNSLDTLPLIQQRLRSVILECLDFRDCIVKYDGPDTLFYCDPPYFGFEKYYDIKFIEKDHEDLSKILKNIKGKFLVSYYPHPFIKELYAGFNFYYKKLHKPSTYYPDIKTKPITTEILITNFRKG